MANRLIMALCLVSIAGAAQAAEWRTYSYTEDGFQADFTGGVEIRRENLSAKTKGAILSVARYTQNLPAGGYAVFVTTFAKPDPRWQEGARSVFSAIGCGAIVDEKVLEVAGVRMLEISGAACLKGGTRAATARFAQIGNRMYQAMAISQPIGEEAANAQRFVQSFSIILVKE